MSQSAPDSSESKQQADRILAVIAQHLQVEPIALTGKGLCKFQLGERFKSYAWINEKQPRLDFMINIGKLAEGPSREGLLLQMMTANLGSDDGLGTSLGLNQKTGEIVLNNFLHLDSDEAEIIDFVDTMMMQAEGWSGTIDGASTSAGPDDLASQLNHIRA